MQVASLELCRTLYKLSEWEDTYLTHWVNTESGSAIDHSVAIFGYGKREDSDIEAYPAYDLGYLLEKLQATATREWSNGAKGYEVVIFWDADGSKWSALFRDTDVDDGTFYPSEPGSKVGVYGFNRFTETGDTAEDAVARLCIELIKQGVL